MDFVGSNVTILVKSRCWMVCWSRVWGGLGVNFVCDSFISHDTFPSMRQEMTVRQ